MSGVTFQPTKISKEFGRVEPVFEKDCHLPKLKGFQEKKYIEIGCLRAQF